jgi:hypothetical protein
MLAQNFKTAADLDIEDAEFIALEKVLGMLEREELRHVPATPAAYQNPDAIKDFYEGRKFSGLFNMVGFAERTECGTAACIAGTCDLLFGTDFARQFWTAGALPPDLMQLFAPDEATNARMIQIRPEQAAIALRNYLTHGEPRWLEALSA